MNSIDLAHLGVEVAPADLGPELDLLDRDVGRLLPGLLGLLGLLVPELAVVHDPAHRRVGHRGHLDEVELEPSGHPQRFGHRLDAELVAVGTDEADLTGSDAVVDAVLFAAFGACYGCSLLCNGSASHVRCVGARREVHAEHDRHGSGSAGQCRQVVGRWPSQPWHRPDRTYLSGSARVGVAGWGSPPLRLSCRR